MSQFVGIDIPSENDYLKCIHCGLCLAVCPTYREQLTETASPRGRVILARKSLQGELELDSNLIGHMYSCFTCMACNDLCPAGIRPADLALAMRQVQEKIHPTDWKQTLFGDLIPKPGRMELATLPLTVVREAWSAPSGLCVGSAEIDARPGARYGSDAAASAPTSITADITGSH